LIQANKRRGHHDITARKKGVENQRAILISQPIWPSTWVTIRLVDTGQHIKCRPSNIKFLDDAEDEATTSSCPSGNEQSLPVVEASGSEGSPSFVGELQASKPVGVDQTLSPVEIKKLSVSVEESS